MKPSAIDVTGEQVTNSRGPTAGAGADVGDTPDTVGLDVDDDEKSQVDTPNIKVGRGKIPDHMSGQGVDVGCRSSQAKQPTPSALPRRRSALVSTGLLRDGNAARLPLPPIPEEGPEDQSGFGSCQSRVDEVFHAVGMAADCPSGHSNQDKWAISGRRDGHKRTPVESDVPRRRPTDCTSRTDGGLGLVTGDVSGSGIDPNGDIIEGVRSAPSSDTAPLDPNSRRWKGMNGGPIATDITRRHRLYTWASGRMVDGDSEVPSPPPHAGGGEEKDLGQSVPCAKDDGIGPHDPHLPSRKNNAYSNAAWARLQRKREPGESNIPRRQPARWISQPSCGLELHADGVLVSDADSCRSEISARHKGQEVLMEPVDSNERGQLVPSKVSCGRENGEVTTADLPRRRSPFVWTATNSGDDVNDSDCSLYHRSLSDGNDMVSNTSGTRVRRYNGPIEGDLPRRRDTDWAHRLDRRLEVNADAESWSGSESSRGGFSQNGVDEAGAPGSTKDTGTGRLRFLGVIGGRNNGTTACTDLPHRRSPYVRTSTSSDDKRCRLMAERVDGSEVANATELGTPARDDTMDVGGAHDHYLASDDSSHLLTAPGMRPQRKHEPIESGVPRRRHIGWTSQPGQGKAVHEDIKSCSGATSYTDRFSHTTRKATIAPGPVKDTGSGRSKSSGGISGLQKGGVAATDVPHRRSPYVCTSTNTGDDRCRLSSLHLNVGEGNVVAENGMSAVDGTMDIDASYVRHAPSDTDNLRSTTAGSWFRRKHDPVESNVPRRRDLNWTSRPVRGLDVHAEVVACTGIGCSMDRFSENNGEEPHSVGFGKDTTTRSLRYWGGIGRGRNEGVTVTDLPRRRSPYVKKVIPSGGDSEVVPVSMVSDDVDEGDIGEGDDLELGMSSRGNASSVDGPCAHSSLR